MASKASTLLPILQAQLKRMIKKGKYCDYYFSASENNFTYGIKFFSLKLIINAALYQTHGPS